MTDKDWIEVYQKRAHICEQALLDIYRLVSPTSPIGESAMKALIEIEQDRRRFEYGKTQA